MSLVEFLRARLDEDQEAARRCAPGPWALVGEPRETRVVSCPTGVAVALGWLRDAEHIASHDPARVLADVAAKRAILDLHKPERVWTGSKYEDGKCTTCLLWESQGYSRYEDFPCPTLRALVAMYADHPDYDPAWRPGREVTT